MVPKRPKKLFACERSALAFTAPKAPTTLLAHGRGGRARGMFRYECHSLEYPATMTSTQVKPWPKQ